MGELLPTTRISSLVKAYQLALNVFAFIISAGRASACSCKRPAEILLKLLCYAPVGLQDFLLEFVLDFYNPSSPRALFYATMPQPHKLRHQLNFPQEYLPLLQHEELVSGHAHTQR